MYPLKTWWNHADHEINFPFNMDHGPCIICVKPGGSVQLDARYTKVKPGPGGSVIEHVDNIAPQLRPEPPEGGKKVKVEEVTGTNDKGYAVTKMVTKTLPEPVEEQPVFKPVPKPLNPNAKKVERSKHSGT